MIFIIYVKKTCVHVIRIGAYEESIFKSFTMKLQNGLPKSEYFQVSLLGSKMVETKKAIVKTEYRALRTYSNHPDQPGSTRGIFLKFDKGN